MTSNGLWRCGKPACWVNTILGKRVIIWPQKCYPEHHNGFFVWTFYVKWNPDNPKARGTHVNKLLLCEDHHNQILQMWEAEMAHDVQEMEATERWLTQINSQALATRC